VGRTVLVVDDDEQVRQLLRTVLEGEGYRVLEAIDGLDAIEQLKRQRPSLILLDLVMPRMDGAELVRELQRRGLRPGISILICSTGDLVLEAARLGADGYVEKPFALPSLLREVARLAVV
jgi:CheY-like chemotaxis protein